MLAASGLSIIPSAVAILYSWRTEMAPMRGRYSSIGREFTTIFQLGRLTAVGFILYMGHRTRGIWICGVSIRPAGILRTFDVTSDGKQNVFDQGTALIQYEQLAVPGHSTWSVQPRCRKHDVLDT